MEPQPGDNGEEPADRRPGAEEAFDIEAVIRTLEGLADIITRSRVAKRPDTVMLRHAAAQMEEWSDGELFAAINHGNERDWSRRPSYYDALIEELKRRGRLPTGP